MHFYKVAKYESWQVKQLRDVHNYTIKSESPIIIVWINLLYFINSALLYAKIMNCCD